MKERKPEKNVPRRKARELIITTLYSLNIGHKSNNILKEIMNNKAMFIKSDFKYAQELFNAVINNLDAINNILIKTIEKWELKRLSEIDKAILQVGLAESIFLGKVPDNVIIDEAIEISKKYSSSKSQAFINGVLDSAIKNFKKKK